MTLKTRTLSLFKVKAFAKYAILYKYVFKSCSLVLKCRRFQVGRYFYELVIQACVIVFLH